MTASPIRNLPPVDGSRFVGRGRELSQIHEALTGGDRAAAPGGPVVIDGPGGLGKSRLAREYALRFASAWPGGIYWLRASGSHPPPRPAGHACRSSEERTAQLALFAAELGLSTRGMDESQLRQALERRLDEAGKPYLWIVDGLVDCHRQEPAGWLTPAGTMGRALITTRSADCPAAGLRMSLDGLPDADATELLAGGLPLPPDANDTITGIIRRLNGHPLALSIAGASCRRLGHQAILGRLEAPQRNSLELGAELAPELPAGHGAPIAVAILSGFDQLAAETKDVLRLAAALGTAPIGKELLGNCLVRADGVDPGHAQRRADRGIRDAMRRALAEAAPDHSVIAIHPLIIHAWRLGEPEADRSMRLRTAATEVLGDALTSAGAPRRLDHVLSHARHLADGADDLHGMHLAGLIGRHEYRAGRYACASRWIRASHEKLPDRLGREHPDTLAAKSALAISLAAEGKLAEARALEEDVLAALQRHLGSDDPDTLDAMANLAETLARLGDIPGACRLYRKLLSLGGAESAPRRPDITAWAFKLFLNLLALDEMPEAIAIYMQYLFWLRAAPVLDPGQQEIRDQLLTHFRSPLPQAGP